MDYYNLLYCIGGENSFKLELFSNKNIYENNHTKERAIYYSENRKVINFKITKGEKIGMESLKKKSIIGFIL